MNVAIKLDKISLLLKAKIGNEPHLDFLFFTRYTMQSEGWEIKDHYETTRLGTYRYVYILQHTESDEGTIYLGMFFNPIKAESPSESARKVKIEYNPTKTYIPQFLKVYFQKQKCKVTSIQSCDIAFDIEGIHADQIRYRTRGDIMTYGNSKDKSTYLRPSSNDGRIKIYDKTRERLKAGKPVDRQIARVEITLHNPDWYDENEIPTKDLERLSRIVDWLAEVAFPTDFKTRIDILEKKYGRYDPAMLHALRSLPVDKQNEVLEFMSKPARIKYRSALFDGDYQPLTISLLDFWLISKNLLSRAVVFEDLRDISHVVNSPHVHTVKIDDEEETETTLSKNKPIKL